MALAPAALRGRAEDEERLLMVTPCKQRFGNPVQNKERGKNTGRGMIREQQDSR